MFEIQNNSLNTHEGDRILHKIYNIEDMTHNLICFNKNPKKIKIL